MLQANPDREKVSSVQMYTMFKDSTALWYDYSKPCEDSATFTSIILLDNWKNHFTVLAKLITIHVVR